MKLYLVKMGLDFWCDDQRVKGSDIGNYRVNTAKECIKGKDGNVYFLEFSRGTRRNYRTKHKITGKPLKKPVIEIVSENVLFLSTQYSNENGCFRNHKLEEQVFNGDGLPYNQESILKVVNMISCDHYDEIVFVER